MNVTGTTGSRTAFRKLLLIETRLAWRVPYGLAAGLGLPVLLLVIFGSIPALRKPSSGLGGLSYFTLSFPILIALTVFTLSTLVLPRSLVTYRETGILRRLSLTPVPPWWMLAAQTVINLGLAAAGIVILTIVGAAAFGLPWPKNPLGFIGVNALVMLSFLPLGLWIAAVAKNTAAAQGIGGLLFYAMMFFGGIWLPRPLMPPILLAIGNWIPLGASVDALQNTIQGAAPSLQSLFVLATYGVAFGYLAVRSFRWE